MLYTVGNVDVKHNIVYAFDLDGTIIQTKSGNVFPKSADDWEFIDNRINKLQELTKNNTVVFITNQKLKNPELAKSKCNSIYAATKIPVFAALSDDFYRKPGIGIFNEIMNSVKCVEFHFIGDAAGRENDHSDCDIKMSYNIAIWCKFNKINCISRFYSPEQFFNGKKFIKPKLEGYDPGTYIKSYKKNNIAQKYTDILEYVKSNDVIIMSGPPGSGKTSFAIELEKLGFYRISMDETPKANVKKLHAEHHRIVVDATHPNLDSIVKYGLSTYIVVRMDVSKEMAIHMNLVRSWYYECTKIPVVAYNIYYKRLEEIDNCVKVVPDIFRAPKVFAYMFAMRT